MAARRTLKDIDRFKLWIAANGGEVLQPTNPYECARFLGFGKTCIIYTNASGCISSFQGGGCQEAWEAFRAGRALRLNASTKRREKASVVARALIARDGSDCFYCAEPFTNDVTPTVEHLVSVTHGGPDHIANKFLACRGCNAEAGHLSAVEKIRLRERKHGFARRQPAPVPFFLCEAA